jgi:hypothetical protein
MECHAGMVMEVNYKAPKLIHNRVLVLKVLPSFRPLVPKYKF